MLLKCISFFIFTSPSFYLVPDRLICLRLQDDIVHWQSKWCIVIISWLICTAAPLRIICGCHAPAWGFHKIPLLPRTSINPYCFQYIFNQLPFAAITVACVTVNSASSFKVCVYISNGRHYKTHLLSPHWVQNNRNVFFPLFLSSDGSGFHNWIWMPCF